MNFMNRKMFQAGGGANALGPYDILDKKTGQITTVRPDFINTPGFNPYKILSDSSLEKGPAVMTILQQFKERDAPQIGPFQMGEDIGTNIADLGFGVARATEPYIRGVSRAVGEITGIQGLKNFGGKQKFSPSIGLGGIDLFKPTYESYVPSDEDRARGMLGLVKERDGSILDPITGAIDDLTSAPTDRSSFDFRDEDMRSKVSQADYDAMQTMAPSFDPSTDPITPMLDELQQERIDLENRFVEEDIQRPADVNVDEITSLLNDIETPGFNLNKTEADSLLETTNKFEGLSPDELKFELDKTKLPGMDALDDQKAQVAKQVKVINQLEAAGIDPDKYFNTARNPVSKKLNEPGFFGSDRFLNFIRNVGAGLAESGQMGPGLVLGAAKAAEERAARDIAADEKKAEMDKLIAIEEKKAEIAAAGGPETSLKKLLRTNAQEMNADYNEVVSGSNTLNTIKRVQEIVLNEDTASVKAFIGEITEKVGVFFDVNGKPSKTGKKFEDLEPRVRAKVLLNNIKQANIREILGESGKTISNLDRQIIDELVGSLTLGTNPIEVLETLSLTERSVLTNIQAAQSRLQTNFTFAAEEGDYGLSLIENNDSLINYIAALRKDPSTLPVGKDYSNKYADVTARRRKITLAKE